jgi:hypothetical protein
MTDEELLGLLGAARTVNAKMGLTGMLLYKNGCFLQVIEGRLRELEQVYAKIEQDPRHTCVTLLRTDYGPRQFPGWTMGFQNLTDWRINDERLGVTDLMSVPFNNSYFGENPSKAQAMLLCFRGLEDSSAMM